MSHLYRRNHAYYWATQFVRELYNAGVKHAVISPGSRSTPLTLAMASHPGIEKHVVLDERSAAFLALGMGKATGIPAALVCTSGTAAANYYPAIIEARQSGVPLLILTADRPPNLRNIGANQAIDQIKMFGSYPVFFHEAGEPIFDKNDFERLKIVADQAVAFSVDKKGPAHINFPFRKPLEPDTYLVDEMHLENKNISQRLSPKTRHYSNHTFTLPREIRDHIHLSDHPLIIAGPENPCDVQASKIIELSKKIGAPVLGEPGSQLAAGNNDNSPVICGYDSFLRNDIVRSRLQPDLILRFGNQPLTKSLEIFLQQYAEVNHIYFSQRDDWQDATYSTSHHVKWDGHSNFDIDPVNTYSKGWITEWKNYAQIFIELREKTLKSRSPLRDADVLFNLTREIPDNYNIFLSNSFPVRDFALLNGNSGNNHPVFVNRGASGIDGIISSAIGATISSKQSGVLFIGDLAFLHDTNALLSAQDINDNQSFVVVILNNNGGNIFRMLPIAEHEQSYESYFETPQKAKFKNIAEAYQIDYHYVNKISNLTDRFNAMIRQSGFHILECATDSEASMVTRKTLWNYKYS